MNVPRAYPNGSSIRRLAADEPYGYRGDVMLELGLVLLSIACFVILDLYVAGCEKI
jgi:hypothetical protein